MLTHIEFLRNFENYKNKNVFILIGPESYPLKTIIDKFENYEKKLFFGDEVSVEDILNFLRSSGFFDKRNKLAIIKNFDELKNWKLLLKLKENKVILYSSLDFYENNLKKLQNVVDNFIKKHLNNINSENYVVVLMPYLDIEDKRKWIIQKLRKMNININSEYIEKLVRILPADLNSCNNELEKIYLCGIENFEFIITRSEEQKIFDFLNYVEKNEFSKAIKLFENSNSIEANAYILRTLLNFLYTYEDIDEYIKPSFIKKQLKKIIQNYEKKDIFELIKLSLLTDKIYKTYHRQNNAILRLLYHIFEKAHKQ